MACCWAAAKRCFRIVPRAPRPCFVEKTRERRPRHRIFETAAKANHPRTSYPEPAPVIAGTGVLAADPYSAAGPLPNDITAALWLLMRTEKTPAVLFLCPYNDVNEFQPDKAIGISQANFTDYRK